MGLFKKKLKSYQILIIIFVILIGLAAVSAAMRFKNDRAQHPYEQRIIVKIGQQEIKAEVASTPARHYQGLSGREAICADCGMLFDFSDYGPKSFVMRNMKFPLDIIFIDDGIIRNIAANLQPEGANPQRIYESGGAANQVLEVNGGYCEKYNIKPGDKIWIK